MKTERLESLGRKRNRGGLNETAVRTRERMNDAVETQRTIMGLRMWVEGREGREGREIISRKRTNRKRGLEKVGKGEVGEEKRKRRKSGSSGRTVGKVVAPFYGPRRSSRT